MRFATARLDLNKTALAAEKKYHALLMGAAMVRLAKSLWGNIKIRKVLNAPLAALQKISAAEPPPP